MTVAMLAGDSILFALTAETSGDYEIFVDAMLPETISEGEQTVRFYDADSASAGRCFLLSATENGIYGLTAAEGLSVYTHPRSELVEDKECVTLSAGMELLVFVSASEAGEYSLSIEYPRAEISGLVAEIAVSLAVNYAYYQYTFTASLDGTYTFHLPAGMGFHSDRAMSEWQSEEIKCEENTDGATVTFEIAEGEVFSFSLFAVSVGEYTVSVSLG